jgi:hypothetical protein
VNSRGICAVCVHCWQANGLGLFAATDVNRRAARITEDREAIVWIVLCVKKESIAVMKLGGAAVRLDDAKPR